MKRLGILLVAGIMACAVNAPAWATQNDLGSANQFGLLSFYGSVDFNPVSDLDPAYVSGMPSCPGSPGCLPDTGAVNIGAAFDDYLGGDGIASRPKTISILLNQQSIVAGQCVTGGGKVLLSNPGLGQSYCAGGIDTSGTNTKVTTLLPGADSDAAAFSATLAGGTPTQTLAAIFLTSGQNYTITATIGGLNLIDLPSIITKGYNTITIDASATDTVVFNIGSKGSPGQLVLGPGTQIVLIGGITPDRVLFNVLGYGAPVTIGRYSVVNGTILAPGDAIDVSTELGGSYANYKNWTYISGALIAGKDIWIGCLVKIYFYPFSPSSPPPPPPPVVVGACLPSSSLAVLVQGTNVVSYVPKASWSYGTTGIDVVQIEGSGTPTTLIPTNDNTNSCASNPVTGQTVCSSNGTDVYLLSGTSLVNTLSSGATGFAGFSGGLCETCGVTINPVTNQALLTEGTSPSGTGAFQFLDLDTNTFETPFDTQTASRRVSEEVLIDPTRNLILSPTESSEYELVDIANTKAPAFFENTSIRGQEFDSAAEDCSTGIALASDEFTDKLYITDLTQAVFTPGSPGSWAAPRALDAFPEFAGFASGTTGISVAQGSHIGIVTGEFGGNLIGAIQLPATSGSGTPAVVDYVACPLPNEPNGDVFSQGLDPHTVTAYVSPNGGDAIGLSADGGPLIGTATYIAVIDLTKLLNTSIVPRTPGTHFCDPTVDLEAAGVVSYAGPLL